MAETRERPPEPFTLRLRRYDPASGEAPYWDEHTVELEPHRSVLEAILQARDRFDGSIGIRCSCRQAICGSCGVRINGEPALACHTHLDEAKGSARGGVIEVEPMGNMPVLKDLIVDMEPFFEHYRSVLPYLINDEPEPEKERPQTPEERARFDDTTKCILCACCTTSCPSFWGSEEYVGPAAIVAAHRFIFDSRDRGAAERLKILNEVFGVYRDPAWI